METIEVSSACLTINFKVCVGDGFSTVRAVALMWILECTCWKEQVSIGLALLQRGKVERKVTLDWVLQPFH